GKSALLQELAARLSSEGVVLLKGRCSEWESVPYKGLDEVIDQLSRLLLRMPDEQSAQFVPRSARAVARVFPTLLRVPTFRDAAQSASVDRNEETLLRQRAVSGIKDMFYRLAERHPIALIIDDLQWVDADTVQLLVELLAPPDTPPLFLLASMTHGPRASELSQALSRVVPIKTLDLAPLDERASRELMHTLGAAAARPFEAEFVERVVRESEGMPLYISELAAFKPSSPEQQAMPRLAHLQLTRIERLSEGARRLLELVAVAVRPLSLVVSGECGIDDVRESLRQLTSERLLRSVALPNGELGFEPYTDSLRQVVLQAMSEPRLEQAHTTLVHALNSLPGIEPQWLLSHYRGAKLYEQAKQYSVIMAEHSLAVLAFEHAASMYRAALELTDESSPDFAELNLKCADALAKAGRGAESAEAYLRAAQGAPPERSFALLNAAVTQWIRAGHISEGVQSLRKTLELVGVSWPETAAAAILRLLQQRLIIRLRGLDYTLRAESEVSTKLLRKLDALNPAQTALGSFDYLRGAMFASIALPLALEAGEPKRLIVALASEAIYASLVEGLSGERRVLELQRRIDDLREHAPGPYERAASLMVRAVSAYWMGLWKEVQAPAEHAEQLLQKDVAGAVWETSLLRSVRHTVLLHAGGLREIAEELPEALRHAASRNDHYAYLDLLRRSVATHLARDDVATASSTIEQLLELRRRYPFLALDHLLMTSVVATHLYAGDIERATHEQKTRWAACRKAGAERLPLVRLTVLGMQGACVQANMALPATTRERELRQLARAAGGEKIGWSEALRHALLADAEECAGNHAQAQVELRMCADLFGVAGLSMAAMAARFRATELLERSGAAAGRAHAGAQPSPERAVDYFTQRGVARPATWVRVVHSLY
ncbi:MAG TPA: AAA family ATPase, partial [Polyangiaceae bacterium]|nr:AAA family ATPase [Polyangiaceae bacterium]